MAGGGFWYQNKGKDFRSGTEGHCALASLQSIHRLKVKLWRHTSAVTNDSSLVQSERASRSSSPSEQRACSEQAHML